jgi:dodecin
MYKIVEVVGISAKSFDDAVKTAVEQTAKSAQVDYFEVIEQRGAVSKGKVKEYQAVIKLGVRK